MKYGQKLKIDRFNVEEKEGKRGKFLSVGIKFEDQDPEWRNGIVGSRAELPEWLEEGNEITYGKDIIFEDKRNKQDNGYWYNWKKPTVNYRLNILEQRQSKLIKGIKQLKKEINELK